MNNCSFLGIVTGDIHLNEENGVSVVKYADTGTLMAIESVARNDPNTPTCCGDNDIGTLTYFRVTSFKILTQK